MCKQTHFICIRPIFLQRRPKKRFTFVKSAIIEEHGVIKTVGETERKMFFIYVDQCTEILSVDDKMS